MRGCLGAGRPGGDAYEQVGGDACQMLRITNEVTFLRIVWVRQKATSHFPLGKRDLLRLISVGSYPIL